MEPNNNTQFTGMSQSESTDASEGGGKAWKIISVIAIILVIGLAAGLVFFMMKANGLKGDNDNLQSTVDTRTAELNRFREVTGVQNPNDFSTVASADVDFSVFFDAMTAAGFSNNVSLSIARDGSSFIKPSADGNFQIASFSAGGELYNGWTALFYRTLPNGDWTYSDLSGVGILQEAQSCDGIAEEEVTAFDGVIECLADEE